MIFLLRLKVCLMITLNINIDHVATLRKARGGFEPDPITAALKAELAGANGIVCHLREDRRHLTDRDLKLLRDVVQTKLDLEMAANDEIIKIALSTKPELVTIVPEKRQELTTEGGLNVLAEIEKHRELVKKMHDKDIDVSYFIEPDKVQIDACKEIGADMVELHTGTYSNANKHTVKAEIEKIKFGAQYAFNSGLMVAGGHGLNYVNIKPLCKISEFQEFSIGHSIIAHSIYTGIEQAVKEMIQIINYSSII